ncbi:NmrA domain-containing protein [Mycena indigotica]|uniref:NmrA domain-containing protein n=1 Tax=Mycena indigotica TaxID=2126181 RepID=A0A8H6VVX8_9AGAR|nr:NmrA domain-containing protein [Mycena indigotica]KAF7290214.1 NmrA domain-containing protein [Mycena indigotica]
MATQQILFIGATGYIGGTVLARLLQPVKSSRNNTDNLNITALVRDAGKAQLLEELGVSAVVGDTNDAPLLGRLAAEADVVFSMAESDNIGAAEALLAGCKMRFERTGEAPTVIHTSGAGIIADMGAMGDYSASPIWDDLDIARLATIAPTQLHRPVDLALLASDDNGYIKSHIVVPPMVYGIARTVLVERGIQRPHHTLLTHIVPPAVARKRGGFIGAGKNVWGHVEVHELADLFMLIFSASPPRSGASGFYFAENGSYAMQDVADVISQTLGCRRRCVCRVHYGHCVYRSRNEAILSHFRPGAAALIASNARCRASRARALGWAPTKGTQDMMESVREVTRNYVLLSRAA